MCFARLAPSTLAQLASGDDAPLIVDVRNAGERETVSDLLGGFAAWEALHQPVSA